MMWTHERHNEIVNLIARNGKISTNDLVTGLSVSRETIRRDLLELEQQGVVQRVHGGAVLASVTSPQHSTNSSLTLPSGEPPRENGYTQRLNEKINEKSCIGEFASKLITNDSVVYIDAGSTTLAFAKALMKRANHLKIITNSIDIASMLNQKSDYEVWLLGGIPSQEINATYGELTLADIDRFRADYAVISPVGVHATYGFSSYHLREAEVARAMMNQSTQRIVLAHSEKLGVQSRVKICSPEFVDHLVIDEGDDTKLNFPRCQIHRCHDTSN